MAILNGFFFNLTLNIAYYLIAGVTKSLSKALWTGRVHHLPCLVYITGCTTRKPLPIGNVMLTKIKRMNSFSRSLSLTVKEPLSGISLKIISSELTQHSPDLLVFNRLGT